MTRRFWIGVLLTVPLVVVAMGRHMPGLPFDGLASSRGLNGLELLLATPVVLWGGWPFSNGAGNRCSTATSTCLP